jgi:uncharacterized phiE125 gp8 family phage protein
VSLEEFKVALRQDNSDEDDFLTTLLEAACTQAEEYLQVSLGDQVRELRLTGTPMRAIRLDMGPVLSIESVKYLDLEGIEQTIDPADYVLVADVLYPVNDWPQVSTEQQGGFRVQYRAGMIDDTVSPVAALPGKVKAAIMLMGQVLYDRNAQTAPMLLKTAHGLLDTSRVGQGL